jgi:hypothetical protein
VETLLNCIWLAVGISLLSGWLFSARGGRCRPEEGILPSPSLQLVALLLLIGLLFPVISVADDFALCSAPIESERAMRLHDPLDGASTPHVLLPAAAPWWTCMRNPLLAAPAAPVTSSPGQGRQQAGTRSPLDSRPPPALL